MLANEDARCKGVTSVRGVPLPCCVKCERRIMPKAERVFMVEFKPQEINRAWECEGRIPYAE